MYLTKEYFKLTIVFIIIFIILSIQNIIIYKYNFKNLNNVDYKINLCYENINNANEKNDKVRESMIVYNDLFKAQSDILSKLSETFNKIIYKLELDEKKISDIENISRYNRDRLYNFMIDCGENVDFSYEEEYTPEYVLLSMEINTYNRIVSSINTKQYLNTSVNNEVVKKELIPIENKKNEENKDIIKKDYFKFLKPWKW